MWKKKKKLWFLILVLLLLLVFEIIYLKENNVSKVRNFRHLYLTFMYKY